MCKLYKTFKLAEKAAEGAGDILKRWAREGANIKVHGLGLRVTNRTYWADLAEDVLVREGVKSTKYLKEPTLVTPKELRERLGLSDEAFKVMFKDALDLRPITALVMGKDSNEFPEFD
jgi:hypothetical protein